MRVVSADSNVVDMLVFRKVFESRNKGRTVVSNNFVQRTPVTDDIIKDPVAKGGRSFTSKVLPFGVCHKPALALDNVLETAGRWHVHGVNVDFAEEGCGSGNCWWNEEIVSLEKLADVAHANEPSNVGISCSATRIEGRYAIL